jgi:hypothetical protein
MRGFDPKWQDVPHYIIGITKDIWEDRKIGSLLGFCADGLIVGEGEADTCVQPMTPANDVAGPYGCKGNDTWSEPTIRREYTLIDDTAIWKQILLKTGAHA